MNILPKATAAPVPKSNDATQVSLFYAGILAVFAVTQLFTFDEFIELILSFNLPLGTGMTAALVPIIVAAEVLALPFLLRMKLSIGFRWLSMILGWLVVVLWLFITISLAAKGTEAMTVGFLGTVIDLVPGWWAVAMASAMGILMAWTSWGLWPGAQAKI